LNTNDFVGSPAYYFEVVAFNNHGSNSYNVELLDNSSTVKATVPVPANSTGPTRIRVSFTPNANDRYHIQLPQTAAISNLRVYSGRMIVQQTSATKTAVYIPLTLSSDNGGTVDANNTAATAVGSTSSGTAASIGASANLPWTKQSSRYGTLAASPFVFEAVGYTAAVGGGFVDLQNCSGATVTSVTVGSSGSVGWVQSAALSNTTDLVDGQSYCVYAHNTGGGTTYVQKAGLWVKMTSFTKAEIYYRVAQNLVTSGSGVWDYARSLINLSSFGSPTVYFEVRPANASGSADLYDGGTVDVAGSASAVSGGSVSWSSNVVTRSSAITLATGANRYMVYQPAGNVAGAYVVVQTQ
jgi:hypothetical protein